MMSGRSLKSPETNNHKPEEGKVNQPEDEWNTIHSDGLNCRRNPSTMLQEVDMRLALPMKRV
jgi:hypothetical protein